jgi:hypothetical protein
VLPTFDGGAVRMVMTPLPEPVPVTGLTCVKCQGLRVDEQFPCTWRYSCGREGCGSILFALRTGSGRPSGRATGIEDR